MEMTPISNRHGRICRLMNASMQGSAAGEQSAALHAALYDEMDALALEAISTPVENARDAMLLADLAIPKLDALDGELEPAAGATVMYAKKTIAALVEALVLVTGRPVPERTLSGLADYLPVLGAQHVVVQPA